MDSRGPSRRDFLVMGAGVFAVSALGLSVARRRIVRRTVPVMGTIAEIAVVTRDERRAGGAISAAIDELHAVHRSMSRFDPASDIGRVNARAGEVTVVGAATATVVAEALRWAALPGGFDPALGRAVELWDVTHRSAPPAHAAVERLAARELWRHVGVERSGGTDIIAIDSPEAALDLGGIAKGWAVDRAVAALRDWGVTDGLVNAGGDLYALGTAPDGSPWTVGIRSPQDPQAVVRTIELTDAAVATSGDYEQYFEHDGHRYHHLLDPATAAPRETRLHSVSVIAASCTTADAAATAVFGLDPGRAAELLRRAAPDAAIAEIA